MRRILFHFFGTPIYSYPAMLYLGIVLGIYAELHAAGSIGLSLQSTLFATLILLSMALLGARLLHVLPLWHVYRHNLKHILHFSNGGASMYGGLLVAVPASFPLLAYFELPFGSFWDVASFTMLVGMVVTRVGCFLNGCCCGRPTLSRWGLNLPNHEGVWRRRIPMQIWEAAWGVVVLAGGILVWRLQPFEGAVFSYAVGAYGFGRLVLESFRDKQNWVRGISVHKAISVGLIAISIGVFATH
jgi:phosphatidylglycerol---prolipoprotein diacylglyceryl transferase